MTITKTKARSVETPGAPKSNPSGLPYGAGSMQIRGRVWWIIYRDIEGRVIQENSHCEDQNEARRVLVARALETMRAKVAALEVLLHETDGQDTGSGAGARKRASRSGSGRVSTKGSRTAGKGGK